MLKENPFYKFIEEEMNYKLMNSEKSFYKYLNLKEKRDYKTGKNINYTIRNLSKNLLYFSHPTEFNDPFDSKIYVNNKGTKEQWIAYLCENHICDDIEAAKKEIRNFIKWEDGLISPKEDISKEPIKVPRVCCFSERNDSILMWSHYADCHKGICLCFRAAKNFDHYYIPLRMPNSKTRTFDAIEGKFEIVDYQKDPVLQISRFNDQAITDNLISKQLLLKSQDWSYEKEYRIIHPYFREYLEFPLESNETFEYYKECLKGVIFGCKVNQKQAERVYKTIYKNYLNDEINMVAIKYYKAVASKEKCKIEIEEIIDIDQFFNDCPVN